MGAGGWANGQSTRQGRGRSGSYPTPAPVRRPVDQHQTSEGPGKLVRQGSIHAHFPKAVRDTGWVGAEGPSEWGRTRADGQFLAESDVSQIPHQLNEKWLGFLVR